MGLALTIIVGENSGSIFRFISFCRETLSRKSHIMQHAATHAPTASNTSNPAWKIGKTPATIQFIDEAEALMSQNYPMMPRQRRVLQERVFELKQGSNPLTKEVSIPDYLYNEQLAYTD